MARLPACKEIAKLDNIPEPLRWGEARVENFREALRGLFEQYEEWQPTDYYFTPAHWREDALNLSTSGSRFDESEIPREICASALNTGVPPDEILAVYSLLFL